MTNRTSGIYCWRTSSGLYVGSAVDLADRKCKHLKLLRKGKHYNKFLQHAYDKHGSDFQFEILLLCDRSDVLRCEQHFIDTLKPRYNLCKIAGSVLGLKHSAETKRALSLAMKKRYIDPAAIERMRVSAKVQWADLQNRERRSIQTKAQWADPEFREKCVAWSKAQWIDPVKRAKLLASLSTPYCKARKAAIAKAQWADPESQLRRANKARWARANRGSTA